MARWKLRFFVCILLINSVYSAKCDRRPYGAITQASISDGRFKLEVVGAQSYIPEQLYVVRLFSTDEESQFTEFMISAEGELRRNPQTRRSMIMDPGLMSPMHEDARHTTNRAGCHNTVEQQSSSPKETVEVTYPVDWVNTHTDEESQFTEFMISAEGELRRNPQTRRPMIMDAGLMSPMHEDARHTTNRAGCHNTVEQQNSSPKETVEVYWTAPKPGSGCVTIRAMVAVNDVEWYEDGPHLSQRICEDQSQPDDITPVINTECSVCEDAKYEISFNGLWTRNTHPAQFPENDEITAFSEMIGASHSIEWSPWIAGGLASDGLRELAEYANASKLEKEIFEQIPEGNVRTLIKGKGHKGFGKISLPAYSYFRADKSHHLVSVAIALSPSPDWFLGISRFELCTGDNQWLQERELNLYPWDAGTDNGVSYESPNIPTYPQDAIERVKMSSYDRNSPFFEMDMKDLHPFGQLHLKLMRTYDRGCEETTEESESPSVDEEKGEESEEPSEPDQPSSESPIALDPESTDDCPLSEWTEWTPCEGPCKNGRIEGFRNRERYFMVNGEPVDKYNPDDPDGKEFEIPEHCNSIERFQVEKCKENTCEKKEEVTVNRQVMGPVAPGQGWLSRKRNINEDRQTTSFLQTVKENAHEMDKNEVAD